MIKASSLTTPMLNFWPIRSSLTRPTPPASFASSLFNIGIKFPSSTPTPLSKFKDRISSMLSSKPAKLLTSVIAITFLCCCVAGNFLGYGALTSSLQTIVGIGYLMFKGRGIFQPTPQPKHFDFLQNKRWLLITAGIGLGCYVGFRLFSAASERHPFIKYNKKQLEIVEPALKIADNLRRCIAKHHLSVKAKKPFLCGYEDYNFDKEGNWMPVPHEHITYALYHLKMNGEIYYGAGDRGSNYKIGVTEDTTEIVSKRTENIHLGENKYELGEYPLRTPEEYLQRYSFYSDFKALGLVS